MSTKRAIAAAAARHIKILLPGTALLGDSCACYIIISLALPG